MQLPSAFETVPSSLTVQICFAESEQSSMNSVWVAVPGTTPSAETHQSPIASWPGVPEPWVGKRAVMSLNEPSPGAVAMSSALGKPPSGAKTRPSPVGEERHEHDFGSKSSTRQTREGDVMMREESD